MTFLTTLFWCRTFEARDTALDTDDNINTTSTSLFNIERGIKGPMKMKKSYATAGLDDNDETVIRQLVKKSDEGRTIAVPFQCGEVVPDIPLQKQRKEALFLPNQVSLTSPPVCKNMHPSIKQQYTLGPMFIPPYTQNAIGQVKWGGGMIPPPPPPPRVHPKIKRKKRKEEVILHKAENPWKSGRTLKQRVGLIEAVNEEQSVFNSVVRKARGILNKLNKANFDSLANQFIKLPLENGDECISTVISIVFEKAIREPSYTALYANMVHIVCKTSKETSKKFRKQIPDLCQKEFQKRNTDEAEIKEVEQKLEEATDDESREQLKSELKEKKLSNMERSLGNIGFIGELFKLQMLTPKIMVECVHLLLYSPDEENLEGLCKLLATVGQKLDMQLKNLEELSQRGEKPKFIPETKWMDRIFKQLESLSSSKKLSSRIRSAILDVLKFRRNDWKPSRDTYVPKTIEEVRKEAYRQELEEKRQINNLPPVQNNYGGGGDRDHRGGGGGGSRLPSSQPQKMGDWTTVSKASRFQTGPNKSVPVGTGGTPIFSGPSDSFDTANIFMDAKDEHILSVVSVVFEKAIDIDEPLCTAVYAEMIYAFCKNPQTAAAKTFRKQILDMCQKESQKNTIAEINDLKQKLEEATDDESRTQLTLELEEKKFTSRRRSLGYVRFIGELCKLQMLSPKSMVIYVQSLLSSPDEVNVECLCTLLTIIGQKLDMRLKKEEELSQGGYNPKFIPETKWMDSIFKQLETLLMLSDLSFSVKHMILDLIKLRTNGWKLIENSTVQEGKQEYYLHQELMKQPPPNSGSGGGGGGNHNNGAKGESNNLEVAYDEVQKKEGKEVRSKVPTQREISSHLPSIESDEKKDERNLEKTEALIKAFMESTVDAKAENIAHVTSTLFANAISSKKSSVSASYAKIVHTVYTKSETHSKKFKKIIVQKCREFINSKFVIFEGEEEKNWRGKRQVDSLGFIGELFNLELLSLEFFEQCFQSLIKSSDEKSLKYLCELLSICGHELEKIRPPSRWMNKAFEHLKERSTNKALSSEILAEISSVLELRRNKWNPSCISNETVGKRAYISQRKELESDVLPAQAQRMDNHGGHGDQTVDSITSNSELLSNRVHEKKEEQVQPHGRSSDVVNQSDLPLEEANSCSTINDENKEIGLQYLFDESGRCSLTGGTPKVGEVLALVNKFLESTSEKRVDRQHVEHIASVVFENAVSSQDPSPYARIVNSVDKSTNSGATELKKQIVNTCTKEFYAKYPTDNEKLVKKKKRAHRSRKISNMRFMGELYKLDVLSAKIIIDSSHYLLNLPLDGENVEYLCELLAIAGEKLLTDGSVKSRSVNSLFYRLSQLNGEKVLSSSIRSEITKVIRMKWKAKREKKTVADGCDRGAKSAQSSSQSQKQGDSKMLAVHNHEVKLNQTEGDGEQSKSERPVSVVIGDTGYPLYCWKQSSK